MNALASLFASAAGPEHLLGRLFSLFDQYPVIPGSIWVILGFLVVRRLRSRRRSRHSGAILRTSRRAAGFLDRPILHLGGLYLTGKMATEGIFTCGELGCGKTFLVFQRVLEAYLRAGMGGYILGAKADDLATVMRRFRALGMEHKLTVIGPRHCHRLNCFDALMSIAPPDSIEEEIIGFFSSLIEIECRSGSKSGGEDTQFFVSHGQRLLGAILICLRLAGERLTAECIYRFLVSLPQTAAQLAHQGWQENSYANQCIGKAHAARKSPRDEADYQNANLYLLGELATLNERTKSSIVSTVSGMLSKLLRGWMAEIFSTTTTVRMQDTFDGQWLYWDMSPLEYGEYGEYGLVTAKHLAQRTVMRRRITADSRAVAIMGDEYQAIFVTADRDYQAVCRSQLGATWAATQNLVGLYAVLGGGPAAEAQAQSWIALFGAKLFMANTCWASNTYASQLCGLARETLLSGNTSTSPDMTVYDAVADRTGYSAGWNEQYRPVVPPEHFVRLRKPEPPANEADAIVIMPRLRQVIGRHWAQITLRPGG